MLLFDKVSNNRNLRIEIERKSSDFKHKVKIIAMRSYIIPIASALVLLSSCSVYREGQTPDDVYYSPARTQQGADYVQADNGREDGRRYRSRDTYNGYDDYAGVDDRWLMMRVRNRSRWSLFDDYNYRETVSPWFRSIFVLDPKGSLMLDAPLVYQVHVTVAWFLFAVWPFTRLVHLWSVPFGYLVRSPIVYRAKRPARRTALR